MWQKVAGVKVTNFVRCGVSMPLAVAPSRIQPGAWRTPSLMPVRDEVHEARQKTQSSLIG